MSVSLLVCSFKKLYIDTAGGVKSNKDFGADKSPAAVGSDINHNELTCGTNELEHLITGASTSWLPTPYEPHVKGCDGGGGKGSPLSRRRTYAVVSPQQDKWLLFLQFNDYNVCLVQPCT